MIEYTKSKTLGVSPTEMLGSGYPFQVSQQNCWEAFHYYPSRKKIDIPIEINNVVGKAKELHLL